MARKTRRTFTVEEKLKWVSAYEAALAKGEPMGSWAKKQGFQLEQLKKWLLLKKQGLLVIGDKRKYLRRKDQRSGLQWGVAKMKVIIEDNIHLKEGVTKIVELLKGLPAGK